MVHPHQRIGYQCLPTASYGHQRLLHGAALQVKEAHGQLDGRCPKIQDTLGDFCTQKEDTPAPLIFNFSFLISFGCYRREEAKEGLGGAAEGVEGRGGSEGEGLEGGDTGAGDDGSKELRRGGSRWESAI